MGDRATIRFIDDSGRSLYMYTHWQGYRTPKLLQAGILKGKGRWTDDIYLARIVFQALLDGDNTELGFGLSLDETENEYTPLHVDMRTKSIDLPGFGRLPFADFAALDLTTPENQTRKCWDILKRACCPAWNGVEVDVMQ